MAERDAKGRVTAGSGSLNPGGRPKVLAEVVDLARAMTSDMLTVLKDLAMDKTQPGQVRADCAEKVLTRAWGKPQTFDPVLEWNRPPETETKQPLAALSVEQLMGLVRAADAGSKPNH